MGVPPSQKKPGCFAGSTGFKRSGKGSMLLSDDDCIALQGRDYDSQSGFPAVADCLQLNEVNQ